MKNIMLTAFIGMASTIMAQENIDINKELNLSTEQTEKLRTIHEKFKPEFRTIMMDSNLTRDEKSKKLKDLRDKEREASKAILSPEQIARFKEIESKKEK